MIALVEYFSRACSIPFSVWCMQVLLRYISIIFKRSRDHFIRQFTNSINDISFWDFTFQLLEVDTLDISQLVRIKLSLHECFTIIGVIEVIQLTSKSYQVLFLLKLTLEILLHLLLHWVRAISSRDVPLFQSLVF